MSFPGRCMYRYDFGDGWEHQVTLRERKDGLKGTRYPRCVDGDGRCPPEDVGGILGFNRFREAMADPAHEDHQELVNWFGGFWEASVFDPASVKFSSPLRRLRKTGLG